MLRSLLLQSGARVGWRRVAQEPAMEARGTASLAVTVLTTCRNRVDKLIGLLSRSLGLHIEVQPGWIGSTYSGAVRLGNAVLHVTEEPSVTMARRVLRRPAISRLVAVELSPSNNLVRTGPFGRRLVAVACWAMEDRPQVLPSLSIDDRTSEPLFSPAFVAATSQIDTPPSPPNVREVVLCSGAGGEQHRTLSSVLEKSAWATRHTIPDIWTCAHGDSKVAVRLIPSTVSALVLGVPDLHTARQELESRGMPCEHIGRTGCSEGQLMLSSPVLDGLDIRLANKDSPLTPFFTEGEEVVMHGCHDELNPGWARARDLERLEREKGGRRAEGEGDRRETEGRRGMRNEDSDGHCWTEFHVTLRHPKGWIREFRKSMGS